MGAGALGRVAAAVYIVQSTSIVQRRTGPPSLIRHNSFSENLAD